MARLYREVYDIAVVLSIASHSGRTTAAAKAQEVHWFWEKSRDLGRLWELLLMQLGRALVPLARIVVVVVVVAVVVVVVATAAATTAAAVVVVIAATAAVAATVRTHARTQTNQRSRKSVAIAHAHICTAGRAGKGKTR
jgi:Flp pilus assembly protein TadB